MPYYAKAVVWLLLLTVVPVLAQTTPVAKDIGSLTEEDYAISVAALADVFGEGHVEKLLLIDQTSIGFPPGMAATTRFGGEAQPLLAQVPKQAKEQFDTRNKLHAKLDGAQLKTPFQIVLVSPEDAEQLVEGGSRWESFRKKYPKTPGITLMSLPGLNPEHTRALIYAGTSCDMLCGNGYFILLGKDGGQWKVLQKALIWVS